jgi:hypothetical protein
LSGGAAYHPRKEDGVVCQAEVNINFENPGDAARTIEDFIMIKGVCREGIC